MNRRSVLLGLAGALSGVFTLPPFGAALLAQRQTFSRVIADTKPLEARGGGGAAAIMRPELQRSLQREFAGRMGRGPVLIARVHTVHLSGFAGGSGDRFGGVPSDYLEGEVVIGSERFPMLVTQSSDIGGNQYLAGAELARMRNLADSFARWIARRV